MLQFHWDKKINATHSCHIALCLQQNLNETYPGATPFSRAKGFRVIQVSIGACVLISDEELPKSAVKDWIAAVIVCH